MGERASVVMLRLLQLVLRGLSWPARRLRKLKRRPLQIIPFRGYGRRELIVVRGRVVDTEPVAPTVARGRRARLGAMLRRLSTPPVPAARVEGRARQSRATVESGSDGMFTLRIGGLNIEPNAQWAPVEIVADAGKTGRARGRGEALIVSRLARFGIISDIDDTVVFTGVANRMAMMWRLFAEEAESRVAFDGVGALYRALHGDDSESGPNPIFYVSRGPWSIYPVLEEFFQRHEIPIGPILMLRDWGIHLGHPWPKRSLSHKRDLIDELLELYPELPFILIGDSGQRDPDIYADTVKRWGSRILCSYIRNVSEGADRAATIERLARDVTMAGSEMVLARDSVAMARHAAERGFISDADVARVERQAEHDRAVKVD